MSILKIILITSIGLSCLTACTTISVTRIDHEGSAVKYAEDGIPFYRPKPYLLLTTASKTTDEQPKDENEEANGTQKNLTTYEESKKLKKTIPLTPETGPVPNINQPACNYQIKLIYLPDYSHGYVISINSWWRMFGTATMKPTLKNGWMLTGFDSEVDSQTDETIGAVAELVSAAGGVISPATFDKILKGNNSSECDPTKPVNGLYEFEYFNGVFTNLKRHEFP